MVDRIFTRVGASDNLAMGESTFMVEMKETAHILSADTERVSISLAVSLRRCLILPLTDVIFLRFRFGIF